MADAALPRPAAGPLAAQPAGDAASAAALRRMDGHLASMKAAATQPLLRDALAALRAGRRDAAADLAAQALRIDGDCGLAWHIQAICREKAGDFTAAIGAYEQALALTPDEPEIANDLGRLALKMGMAEIAEKLFANYLARRPDSLEGRNNLACAQRDLMRFGQAIDTLSEGLRGHPDSALLWNALAGVLTLQGQMDQALVFYDEALRLEPAFGAALYNRSIARLALGDGAGALADLEAAEGLAATPRDAAGMRVARAKTLLALGDLARGWEAYEARLDPHYEDAVRFLVDRPAWTPDMDPAGLRILLIGEQGLGDEILFAHALPDLVEAVGASGSVTLATDPRLVTLFARSFTAVRVLPHASGRIDHVSVRAAPDQPDDAIDAFAPLGALLRRYRGAATDFRRGAFLTPDPTRVARWRETLAGLPGLKVGILWKSLVMDADRLRQFAPFDAWAPVLATPGITFVDLQYGDSGAETEAARAAGVALWRPQDIDLKDDLDSVAALTCALDLTIGPANATTNLAGACGAPLWLISTPHAWPRLGRDDYPWYPEARVFALETYGQWAPVMDEIAAALREAAAPA